MHWLGLLLLLLFTAFIGAHESFARFARLSILENMDIPGGDYGSIKDASLQSCRDECLKDDRCKAYTFNHRAKVCFLKERVSKRKPFKGATSGVKFGHGILATTTEPPIKAIINTWARSDALCLNAPKHAPATWAWCDVSEALGVVLQVRNWCRGKKGEDPAKMVWHKCEATSLRKKIPKSVSSLGGE